MNMGQALVLAAATMRVVDMSDPVQMNASDEAIFGFDYPFTETAGEFIDRILSDPVLPWEARHYSGNVILTPDAARRTGENLMKLFVHEAFHVAGLSHVDAVTRLGRADALAPTAALGTRVQETAASFEINKWIDECFANSR